MIRVFVFLLGFLGGAGLWAADPSNAQDLTKSLNINLDELLSPYDYSSKDRRDPFIRSALESEFLEGEEIVLTGAQKYAITTFRLLAVIWGDCRPPFRNCQARNARVMLADPQKKIHYLKKGDRIGPRGAYLELIREGEIVILQPYRSRKQILYRAHVITLEGKKKQEEIGP